MGKGTLILFIWLIIGAAAAGPLNDIGLDPKISCAAPKPPSASG